MPDKYFQHYKGKVPDPVAKFYGMIENIDENMGRLLAQLKAWGISDNTLVIFMTDNGTATGATVFNAGMRGSKNSPYQGGTRVPSFWRWPAGFQGGVDCNALTAHIDILAHARGDFRREAIGRCEAASRGPQLVAAAQESRKPSGPTGFLSRTLGAGHKGRPRIRSMQAARFATGNTRW